MYASFDLSPQVLNRVEVRALSGPSKNLQALFAPKFSGGTSGLPPRYTILQADQMERARRMVAAQMLWLLFFICRSWIPPRQRRWLSIFMSLCFWSRQWHVVVHDVVLSQPMQVLNIISTCQRPLSSNVRQSWKFSAKKSRAGGVKNHAASFGC